MLYDFIDRRVKRSKKGTLKINTPVKITQAEINTILSEKSIKYQKLMFVYLVLAKYYMSNNNSDKYYVGQSINSFDIRYKSGWLYEHSKKDTVKHDLELYGENSFEYIKLFKVAHSQYELDKLEAYYINYYDSYEKGYNENRKGREHIFEYV